MRRNKHLLTTVMALLLMILVTSDMNIKWQANQDGPEASKVPRSQNYWNEHNIERPEYAKTDAEIRAERRSKSANDSNPDERSGIGTTPMVLIIFIFVTTWVMIIKVGMGGGTGLGSPGKKLGSVKDRQMTFSRWGKPGAGQNQGEIARDARLARFQVKAD